MRDPGKLIHEYKPGFDSSNLSLIIEINHIGDAVPNPLLHIQKELLSLHL